MVKRNVVSDAHLPRVPRKGRKVWTVAQLQTFLQLARSDRFFALWVLEATSGMRRCELACVRRDLLDLDTGTLTIEATRVIVDGRVIESDGKTENADQPQHRPAAARRPGDRPQHPGTRGSDPKGFLDSVAQLCPPARPDCKSNMHIALPAAPQRIGIVGAASPMRARPGQGAVQRRRLI